MAGFLVFDNRIRFTNPDGTLTPEALYRLQTVVAGLVSGATTLPATSITFSPTGGLSSTDMQAIGAELDAEKQPVDATLTALAGVVTAANKLVYATGVDAFATTDFSPFSRTLLDDADAATMRTTLGVASGADLTAHTSDTSNPHSVTAVQAGAVPLNGALGIPTSGTLTNCTDLPVSSGISGLGANVATFLATPSSANLRTALTDETGSGFAVFATAPDVTNAKLLGTTYTEQGAPASKAAAATLTIAELLTGIIEYTGAAAALTLPDGTDIEAGILAGLANDRAFEFSVINTGAGTATVSTAAGLTLTGSMAVAAGTSARFRVRKTNTNTYTVYRV
jgi:hypothetical protein